MTLLQSQRVNQWLTYPPSGKEIMGTFRNIKCMMRKEPFADVENINSIEIAVLEIAMNPEVCDLQRTDKRWEMGDGR